MVTWFSPSTIAEAADAGGIYREHFCGLGQQEVADLLAGVDLAVASGIATRNAWHWRLELRRDAYGLHHLRLIRGLKLRSAARA